MNWALTETKSGHVTVTLKKMSGEKLLHSKYNPVREAEHWVDQWGIMEQSPKRILVIGLGAGYHVEELNRKFPHISITIWEFNSEYVKWLCKSERLERLAEIKNIKLCVSDDWEQIRNKFLPLLDDTETMVLLHSPSLDLIPDKLSSLKELLENHVIFLRTVRRHASELENNFNLNLSLKDKGIVEWKDKLVNKSVILISAGPSLTKQLPTLADIHHSGKVTLCTVGTALKPLLNYGIKPDLVMVSDPQDNISKQFPDTNDTSKIPLFYLSTANHLAVSNYQGPRFIVWQKGYARSQIQAELRGEPLIQTGGSVATCLLDLLVWMGSSRVALVGQDLAFSNGYSHAEGTHNVRRIRGENTIKIQDYYQQGSIVTSKNLNIYLKWFEKYSRSLTKRVELWNCTEGGAYIPGWTHKKLLQFVDY